MAADARARAEGLEAEGLGLGAADDVPEVDAQVVAEHGHLVDQGDVDVAEVRFEDLDGLGLARSARADDLVGEASVEGGGRFGARGGEAADDLGGVGVAMGAAAGVDPAGGVREMEVAAGAQPGALFEDRAEERLRGAGLDGRFEQHGGVRAQPRGECPGGLGESGEIEGPVGSGRGGGTDDGGAYASELGRVRDGPEATGEHAADVGRSASRRRFGQSAWVGVIADGLDADGYGGLGEGQAEMTESDDGEICGHGVGRPSL